MSDWWRALKLRLLRWGISSLGPEELLRLEPSRFLKKRLQGYEDAVARALGGAMSFHVLRTAHALGLFKLLHATPGLPTPAIARALGTTDYATEVLLLALTPMDLVSKAGDRYFNNPLLSPVLSGEMDEDRMGAFIDYFHHVVNPAVAHLEESVRHGRPAGLTALFGEEATSFYQAVARDARLNRYFERAMGADTRFNRDRAAADKVFGQCRNILDVGGNTGELAAAIVKHHPATRVTVLDFPEVAARARARFRAEGLEDRLAAASGDVLDVDFPRGHDCILFAHFIDIFSRERVQALMRRAHASLPAGGKLVVFGSVVRDDERGPLSYGVLSAYFLCLAGGEGRFYTARQTADAMREAGFVRIRRRTLPMDEAIVVGSKAG